MNKKESVLKVLSGVVDPWMKTDYLSARMVKVDDEGRTVKVELGYPAASVKDEIRTMVESALHAAGIVGTSRRYITPKKSKNYTCNDRRHTLFI